MEAYTYSIDHLPSKTIYYGVRKSKIFDLGITYFSSSKLVKRMILTEGIQNFKFKLRRKFSSYEEAKKHETKMLKRLSVVSNPKFLNQAVSSPMVCKKDSETEKRRRASISKRMKELWSSEEYRKKQTFNILSKEERIKRGKKGAQKKAENYKLGKTKRKPKKIPTYTDVKIIKNNVIKTIKSNQVPAYKKIGWKRYL